MIGRKYVVYGGEPTRPLRLMKYCGKSEKSSSRETPRVEDLLADAILERVGYRPEREYRFTPLRNWKFDLAFPDQMLAVEIAGRYHLTHKRFRQDCERNNFAQQAGWQVWVFPSAAVVAKSRRSAIVEQIARFLCGVRDPELDCGILTQPLR